jgi:hypothetical protein
VLPSERKKLSEKAKKMADKYSWIVFKHKSIGASEDEHTHSFMQFKSKILSNQKADRYFYETMMIFAAKVLQPAFDKQDLPKLEEEINRLFRSNAFNISSRVQFDELRKKKYPQLKEAGPKETTEQLLKRMEMRIKVPKEKNRQSYIKSKTEIRPLFSRLTPHGATYSRSPLVSMIFPSLKDKMKIFQEEQLKPVEEKRVAE